MYVAGYLGKNIYEYSLDRVLIRVIAAQNEPVGLVVDSDSKLYVSEGNTGKIHVYKWYQIPCHHWYKNIAS